VAHPGGQRRRPNDMPTLTRACEYRSRARDSATSRFRSARGGLRQACRPPTARFSWTQRGPQSSADGHATALPSAPNAESSARRLDLPAKGTASR
jgi:hypothetical protein